MMDRPFGKVQYHRLKVPCRLDPANAVYQVETKCASQVQEVH